MNLGERGGRVGKTEERSGEKLWPRRIEAKRQEKKQANDGERRNSEIHVFLVLVSSNLVNWLLEFCFN